jgi:hypothetical protein
MTDHNLTAANQFQPERLKRFSFVEGTQRQLKLLPRHRRILHLLCIKNNFFASRLAIEFPP